MPGFRINPRKLKDGQEKRRELVAAPDLELSAVICLSRLPLSLDRLGWLSSSSSRSLVCSAATRSNSHPVRLTGSVRPARFARLGSPGSVRPAPCARLAPFAGGWTAVQRSVRFGPVSVVHLPRRAAAPINRSGLRFGPAMTGKSGFNCACRAANSHRIRPGWRRAGRRSLPDQASYCTRPANSASAFVWLLLRALLVEPRRLCCLSKRSSQTKSGGRTGVFALR